MTEDTPQLNSEVEDIQALVVVDAWKHSDFLCRSYVLNGLVDTIYNMYISAKTAKELWESLEHKFSKENVTNKEFLIERFLEYKMVDSKTVVNQVKELQLILDDIHAEGITLSETFLVAAIIGKLPPGWVNFKSYLKTMPREMSLEDLLAQLRLQEDNNLAKKKVYFSGVANVVEHGESSTAKE